MPLGNNQIAQSSNVKVIGYENLKEYGYVQDHGVRNYGLKWQ